MTSNQYTVTTGAAVALFTGPGRVKITSSGSGGLAVGGSGVTSGTGMQVAGTPQEFVVSDNSTIYGIAFSSTQDVRVLSWY